MEMFNFLKQISSSKAKLEVKLHCLYQVKFSFAAKAKQCYILMNCYQKLLSVLVKRYLCHLKFYSNSRHHDGKKLATFLVKLTELAQPYSHCNCHVPASWN